MNPISCLSTPLIVTTSLSESWEQSSGLGYIYAVVDNVFSFPVFNVVSIHASLDAYCHSNRRVEQPTYKQYPSWTIQHYDLGHFNVFSSHQKLWLWHDLYVLCQPRSQQHEDSQTGGNSPMILEQSAPKLRLGSGLAPSSEKKALHMCRLSFQLATQTSFLIHCFKERYRSPGPVIGIKFGKVDTGALSSPCPPTN
jgi:hypothetical protein